MNSPGSVATLPVNRSATISSAAFIAMFSVLTAIGAQIEIPHLPVPFTLQTFFVVLSGGVLGMRRGAMSQVLYLLCGIAGVPVFSHFGFGFARLLGPTGGYLLGFPIAAYIAGYLFRGGQSFWRALVSMSVGMFIIFTLGTLQLYLTFYHDIRSAIINGFLIFSWWDMIKILASAGITSALSAYRFQK
jgi:biotin transport system substrate-specific component